MSYFTGDNQSQNTPTIEDQNEDWVKKVVEQKGDQWSDPQTLAKGYANAQALIEQLKQTNAELTEDLGKKNYTEELLEEIRKGKAQPTVGEPNGNNNSTEPNGQTDQAVSEDRLKSLIDQTITQREQENTAARNIKAVEGILSSLFGTEVEKEMTKRASELGMSKERLGALAAESPTAFFRLIGEEAPKVNNPTTNGTVNTNAASFENTSQRRNWQYYQNLRRENPNAYYSPRVQNQMLQDKLQQGDAFGNR